jgi:hypothetical protein
VDRASRCYDRRGLTATASRLLTLRVGAPLAGHGSVRLALQPRRLIVRLVKAVGQVVVVLVSTRHARTLEPELWSPPRRLISPFLSRWRVGISAVADLDIGISPSEDPDVHTPSVSRLAARMV